MVRCFGGAKWSRQSGGKSEGPGEERAVEAPRAAPSPFLVEGDKTMGRYIFNICKAEYKSYPDFASRIVDEYKRVPDLRHVFWPSLDPIKRNVYADIDHTDELQALAHAVVAGVVRVVSDESDKRHMFRNVDARPCIQACIDGKTWRCRAGFTVDLNAVMRDWMIQLGITTIKNDPGWGTFTDDDWRRQIKNLWNIDASGRSTWCIPASRETEENILPMQFMIAFTRHFAPHDWEKGTIQAAVRNSFEPTMAKKMLALADGSENVASNMTVDRLLNEAVDQLKEDVRDVCEKETIVRSTEWKSHCVWVPGADMSAEYRCEEDTRDEVVEHGELVRRDFLQSTDLLQYAKIDTYENQWSRVAKRPHKYTREPHLLSTDSKGARNYVEWNLYYGKEETLFAKLFMYDDFTNSLTAAGGARLEVSGAPVVKGSPLAVTATFGDLFLDKYIMMKGTFEASDYERMTGELLGMQGESCPVVGRAVRDRELGATGGFDHPMAGQLRSTPSVFVQSTRSSMSEKVLFRLPPPNASELYTDVWRALMDAAYAVYPEEQRKRLKIDALFKNKHVPDYLKDVVAKAENTKMLNNLVTAQLAPAMFADDTKRQWASIGSTEESIRQRAQYFMQGNDKGCLSTDPAFTEVYDAIVAYQFTKHMPDFGAYLEGQGGKSSKEWAEALFDYATGIDRISELAMTSPKDGQITKLSHMLTALSGGAVDKHGRTLGQKLADRVMSYMTTYARKFAGALPEEQTKDIMLKVLTMLFDECSKDPREKWQQEVRDAFKMLNWNIATGLASACQEAIRKVTEVWRQNASARVPTRTIIDRCMGCLSKSAEKVIFTVALHALSCVSATFGIYVLAADWDSLTNAMKADLITSSVFAVGSLLAKGFEKYKGISISEFFKDKYFTEDELYYSCFSEESFYSCRSSSVLSFRSEDAGRALGEATRRGPGFGKKLVNFVTKDVMDTCSAVVGVVSVVALTIGLVGDFTGGASAAVKTLDALALVFSCVDLACTFTVMAGVEVAIGVSFLTVPVVGAIAAVLGLVCLLVENLIRQHTLDPYQDWVEELGVDLLKRVPAPSDEWIREHPDPAEGKSRTLAVARRSQAPLAELPSLLVGSPARKGAGLFCFFC